MCLRYLRYLRDGHAGFVGADLLAVGGAAYGLQDQRPGRTPAGLGPQRLRCFQLRPPPLWQTSLRDTIFSFMVV